MGSRTGKRVDPTELEIPAVPKSPFDVALAVNEPQRRRVGRPITSDKASYALPMVVRTPCPRCGVRADVGCKCRTGELGWHVG